jgi:hypothetical protein
LKVKLISLGVVSRRTDIAEHRSGASAGAERLPDRRCIARRGPPIDGDE